MKNIIKIAYIVLLEMFFVSVVALYIYNNTSLRQSNYLNYLPKHKSYLNYDIETNTTTNANESIIDYANVRVPYFNMLIERAFCSLNNHLLL